MVHEDLDTKFAVTICDCPNKLQKNIIINVVDRELACVPNISPEGESYRKSMFSALNFAWANRQMITHWTRMTFQRVLKMSEQDLDMKLVYDVSHNIAKVERHKVDGEGSRRFGCT